MNAQTEQRSRVATSRMLNLLQSRGWLLVAFVALLMLVVCRELNLYCFRSAAKNDTAAVQNSSANRSMMSSNQNHSTL